MQPLNYTVYYYLFEEVISLPVTANSRLEALEKSIQELHGIGRFEYLEDARKIVIRLED